MGQGMFAQRSSEGLLISLCDPKVQTELLPSLPFWSPELMPDSFGEIMNQTEEHIQLPPER